MANSLEELFGVDPWAAQNKADEDDAYRYARLGNPNYAQESYRMRQGENMLGRGIESAFAGVNDAMGGQPNVGTTAGRAMAMEKVRAELANVDPNDEDAMYRTTLAALSRNGFPNEARALSKEYADVLTKRQQTKLYAAQTDKTLADAAKPSTSDVEERRMRNYMGVLDALKKDPNNPNLLQAKRMFESLLGDKVFSEWDVKTVAPGKNSPGYVVKVNKRTGEVLKEPLGSMVAEGGPSTQAGAPLSPFEPGSEADKAFQRTTGKTASEWISGDRDTAMKGIGQLQSVVDELEKNPDLVNDPLSSNLPDWMRATTKGGAAAIDARDRVYQAVQSTLRATLGPQFTQKEGEMLMARAYDPRLTAAQNIDRLTRAIEELRGKIAKKDALAGGRRPSLTEGNDDALKGSGTAADPYRPATQEQYDSIPSGRVYLRSDGTKARKG